MSGKKTRTFFIGPKVWKDDCSTIEDLEKLYIPSASVLVFCHVCRKEFRDGDIFYQNGDEEISSRSYINKPPHKEQALYAFAFCEKCIKMFKGKKRVRIFSTDSWHEYKIQQEERERKIWEEE